MKWRCIKPIPKLWGMEHQERLQTNQRERIHPLRLLVLMEIRGSSQDKDVLPISLTWESSHRGKTVFILKRGQLGYWGPASVCKHSTHRGGTIWLYFAGEFWNACLYCDFIITDLKTRVWNECKTFALNVPRDFSISWLIEWHHQVTWT